MARRAWLLAAPLLALLVLVAAPIESRGATTLLASSPERNETLQDAPAEIRLQFRDPIDHARSEILLLDRHGDAVEIGDVERGVDDQEIVAPLRSELASGTYTVQWRGVAAEDETASSGFFAFTVGADGNLLPGLPPETTFDSGDRVLSIAGRWLTLLGVASSAGIVVMWAFILRPVLDDGPIRSRLARWLSRIALAGVVIALAGLVMRFLGPVSGEPDLTSDGTHLLLHAAQLIVLAAILLMPAFWRGRRAGRSTAIALIAAATALVPLVLSGHAATEAVGRGAAMANYWLHLLGTSVWVGGLLTIGVYFILIKVAEHGGSADTSKTLAARSVTAAIASTIILALTGLYATDLTVGNVSGLTQTAFGNNILLKAGATILTVALVSAGFLVNTYGGRLTRSTGPLALAFGAGSVAILLVLALSAFNADQPAARETLLAESERLALEIDDQDIQAMLYVSPGEAGFNRVTMDLDTADRYDASSVQSLVRVTPLERLEGSREVILFPTQMCTADGAIVETTTARFDASGAEMSVAGKWQVDLLINDPSRGSIQRQVTLDLPAERATVDVPDPPLRFAGFQATLAFLTGAVALILAVVLVRHRGGGGRTFIQFALFALMVFTVSALWQGKITHTPAAQLRNPIPRTAESVEIGRDVYAEYCAVCHGDDGQGDGPSAASLERRPADLTASHMDTHPVGDIVYWIREGIDPAMPGFGDQLTDDEVWHLVNYLRSLRNPVES